jgi:hypothetical protein
MGYMSDFDIVLQEEYGYSFAKDYTGDLSALQAAFQRYIRSDRMRGDGDDLALSVDLYLGPQKPGAR